MKNSSLIALIGVCVLVLMRLISFSFEGLAEYLYYNPPIHTLFQVIEILAWCCIGQFFRTLYKKSK